MDNVQLANALFDAIEAGHIKTFLSLCTPDAHVVDVTEGADTPIAQEAAFMAQMPKMFRHFKYARRRYTATDDGAALQHTLQGETQSGHTVNLPIMIRMYSAGGRVQKMEEYYDGAEAAAIFGATPLRDLLKNLEKAFEKGPEAVNALLAPDLASENLTPMYTNRDGFWKLEETLGKVFPDYTQVDTHYVEQDNMIVRRIVSTVTQAGQFMGVPATGRKATFEGFEMFEIVEGKIVRDWILPDVFSLLQQIGAIPDTVLMGPKFGVD